MPSTAVKCSDARVPSRASLPLIPGALARVMAGCLLLLLFTTAPVTAAPTHSCFLRTATGAWLALAYDADGVWLVGAAEPSQPDQLTTRVPLVGKAGAAPLTVTGPITAATGFLDGSDRLHLSWLAGGNTLYARCPLAQIADAGAWQGPMGGPAPETVAQGVAPVACALANGARPVVAGTRGEDIAVLRFEGEWRDTLLGCAGRAPVLMRDSARDLHLAFAAPDGVRYCRTTEGNRWSAEECVLPGKVVGEPSLVVSEDRPVIAAVVDGQAMLAVREAEGWTRRRIGPVEGTPRLACDRYGLVWCLWQSGGRAWAARWQGTALGAAFPLGPAEGLLLTEQLPLEYAPDIGLLLVGKEGSRVLRLPVPGATITDRHPVRFLDMLEVASLRDLARIPLTPVATGQIPLPASDLLFPGGLVESGRDGKDLRAWFSRRIGENIVGFTSEWSRGAWSMMEPLRLLSPRPWLVPPGGAMAVIADPEEPAAARRYKMAAAHVGKAPALMASGDGISWSYHAELPPMAPLSLLRDRRARAEERWKIYAEGKPGQALSLYTSPDQEHWYPTDPPHPELGGGDGVFWMEEGRVLGLLNGGRNLAVGRSGDRVMPIATLPALPGDGKGRLFAPPVRWEGRWRLFLAEPGAWRWAELPAGRWIGLRAEGERPGTCVTIPITLVPGYDRRLQLDMRVGRPGAVEVALLEPSGRPLEGYTTRLTRGDGWLTVSWKGGKSLDRLKIPAFCLRFTVEPGATLYGFRFVE